MSVSIAEFWKLAVDSRLLTAQQCQALGAEFAQVKGAGSQGNCKTLAEWLIAKNVLSRYQATILRGGRAGPFLYGDYKIYDRLEGGRLAGLFRAVHPATGHPVLLRFLAGAASQDPQLWPAVAAHTQVHCRLSHPHLDRFHELVDLVAFKFLVMDDLHGQTVEEQVANSGRLPVAEACRLIRQAALALDYLHQQGQIHGDVRPQNFWLQRDANLKLLRDPFTLPVAPQFGAPGTDADLSARADYLAPEFTRPGTKPDALTDVYALGCSLYRLLAGQPPFAGGDLTAKLQRHAKQPVQPLEPLGVPQPVAQVTAYLMAKNPAVRYQRAAMVAEQLAPFVDPARLQVQWPAPTTTQTAFETWVRDKQQTPASRPAAHTATAPGVPIIDTVSRTAPEQVAVAVAGTADGQGAASLASRRQQRSTTTQSNMAVKLALALGGVGLLLVVGLIVRNSLRDDGNGQPTTPVVDGNPLPATVPAVAPSVPLDKPPPQVAPPQVAPPRVEASAEEVVPDDGTSLWASPTSGSPLQLNFMPPGSQVFVAMRPADMLNSAEGTRVMQALGPEFDKSRTAWEEASGVAFNEVEQLMLGLFDDGEKLPRPCFLVRLSEPLGRPDLLSRWGSPSVKQQGATKFYTARGWSFYIPDGSQGFFVMGSEPDITESIGFGGGQPGLRSGMAALLAASDADRHLTVLFAPNYLSSNLLRDGRSYYFGAPRPLRQAIEWLLGEDLQAGMISMHFGDTFYWESQLAASLNKDRLGLASEFRDRIQQVPDRVESHIAGLNPHPYWRRVAFRYPGMVRFLHGQTRIGLVDDRAVVNCALPGFAAKNLVFGGEMLLVTRATLAVAGTAQPKGPQTLDQLLAEPTDLSFPQKSLEFAMRDLAEDIRQSHMDLPFAFDIEILGDDLKLNGITRNQQIAGFEAKDKPISEILTALVMKANPITTVKDPSELDQKLIWVVTSDPAEASKKIVLITTRDAAESRKYTLPPPFRPK